MTPDRVGLTRVVDEFLWRLRRDGFAISTSQGIDAVRAVVAVGLEARAATRDAVAAVVVDHAKDRARYDTLFDEFFASGRQARGTLWDRLRADGFTDPELDALKELLELVAAGASDGGNARLGALLERGPELDRLLHLAGVARALGTAHSTLQTGFLTYRLLEQLGMQKARERLAMLGNPLRDALGEDRAKALLVALERELSKATEDVRAEVQRAVARRQRELDEDLRERHLSSTAFTSLSDAEVDEVRRAVRSFAERLRGAARVRAKRSKKGRILVHQTLRSALRTGGVPFVAVRRSRQRDRPRVVVLCDISDSVRQVARFMLEFVYAVHELFDRTRSFVFVSELGETTDLFARDPVSLALGKAYGGHVVSITDNSNYGRVLRDFEERYLSAVDRRTTVVILGDGRTNYHEDSAEVLDRIRARARSLLWLCPEERSGWSLGDSAMPRYAPKCTTVLEVRTARDLEEAARRLLRHR